MTMHVNLGEKMEDFIRAKVAEGMYGNHTEVIRDAVRRLQAEEARVAAWQAATKVGEDQLIAGQGVPYTPDTMKRLQKRAGAAVASGKPLNPDVLP